MAIIAKESQGEFHTLPIGNYRATCFDVWDIGLQKGEYKGEPNVTHKVIIGFEVDERVQSNDDYNGKRYRIYGWYTLSLGKKSNLRRDLTSWRGKEFTEAEAKGFDIEKLIGANCLLNIIHKDDGKPKISAITSLPKGMDKMEAENARSVPEWVAKFKAKAISEEEAQGVHAQAEESKNGNADVDDSVPF